MTKVKDELQNIIFGDERIGSADKLKKYSYSFEDMRKQATNLKTAVFQKKIF